MTALIRTPHRNAFLLVAAALPLLACTVTPVAAGPPESEWISGYNSRVRLIGGSSENTGGRRFVAGVEIETKPDWKTYWRNPGDAGVPPAFDWSKSTNVATAEVRYPAPQRLVDKSGITIGYLGGVVFPVMVTPADPAKPVALKLTIDYGVCKDICVPAQADLTLDIAPKQAVPMPGNLSDVMRDLPSARGKERAGDPVVRAVTVELGATPPSLTLDVEMPDGAAADAIDAFLVTDEGGFMPLPSRADGPKKGMVRLIVDLSKDVDLKELRGKTVFATVTAPSGASEIVIAIK